MYRHELIQQLRTVCATLYSDAATARRVAYDAGLDGAQVNFQGAANEIWQDLLTKAQAAQRFNQLLAIIEKEYPKHAEVQTIRAALAQFTTHRNPFQYLLPVEADAFVGRRALVRAMAIDLTLDNGDSHALIAGRRCGKSSLLFALADEMRRQPAQNGDGDWLVLPLYFDFKAGNFPSVEAFFARILNELCRRVDVNSRRRPVDAWPTPVRLDAGWFIDLVAQAELTLRDFEDAAGYLLDQLGMQLGSQAAGVRVVLLLDEVDETLDEAWTYVLFNQLRALIYSSDLRSQVRLVLAGSRRFLDQVSDRGSPLWNVLKLHYLTVFDRTGFDELTAKWSGMSESVADAVWAQSGGHPFLAQYLYHHLWLSQETVGIDAQRVVQLVQQFYAEQMQDLIGWVNGIEATGLITYGTLADTEEWLTEEAIGQQINQSAQRTKRGLTALCYHGLAVHEHWQRYCQAGHLFGTWFNRYARAILAADTAMTPAAAETIVQQITNVYTGGGSYIGGDVGTDGGDFVSRDQSDSPH